MSNDALKFDTEKVRHELISDLAMDELAKVLTFGAAKYEEDNWRKGMDWRRLIGSTRRHLLAFSRGENKDPESGLPHLAHAMCNLMFLLEYQLTGVGKDDRFVPKAASTPIDAYNARLRAQSQTPAPNSAVETSTQPGLVVSSEEIRAARERGSIENDSFSIRSGAV